MAVSAVRVRCGTSGHRGSAFARTFNEAHILAITQAICLYLRSHGADDPLLGAGLREVRRMPEARARAATTTHRHDYITRYVDDLTSVIDIEAIRRAGVRIGVDPPGGAAFVVRHRPARWVAGVRRRGKLSRTMGGVRHGRGE